MLTLKITPVPLLFNVVLVFHNSSGQMQLPAGINDAELQERIIQHLAAAAAIGRTHRVSRRDGSRSRSSAHARPQFVVYSGHPPGSSAGSGGEGTEPIAAPETNPSVSVASINNIGSNQNSAVLSRPLVVPTSSPGSSNDNRYYYYYKWFLSIIWRSFQMIFYINFQLSLCMST